MADAREQLRRYLEQRREMGESELVLDSLTVDDALVLLGVKAGGAPAPRVVEAPPRVTEPALESSRNAARSDAAQPDVDAGVDWRATLRATGASPEEVVKKKIGRYEFPSDELSTPSAGAPPSSEERRGEMVSSATSSARPVDISAASDSAAPNVGSGFAESLASLEEIAAHVASCTRCTLYSTATNPVPGEGNPNADLMCVGEAPGATEDETGRPFIGAAGQLLTKILEAIQLSREQVFICNVLKHRPPGNRNPVPEEVTACSPYLIRQIELVKPKVIIALGTFAAQTLLKSTLSLGKLRGQIHRFHGVPLIVTYHPAALLRNPSWKRPTWEDVQLARRILDSAQPGA